MSAPSVAVLFARRDSVYKADPRCDVYDFDRNALTFPGGLPVIAHPPCRSWGSLRALAKPAPGEKDLAIFAVDQVRQWGGVLEHPRMSRLWPVMDLPAPGCGFDRYGGFSIGIDQNWFGHRAQKRTLLYVVGCNPSTVPAFPLSLGEAPRVVTNKHGLRSGQPGYRPEITKSEREHTPAALAAWLVALAQSCAAPMELAA